MCHIAHVPHWPCAPSPMCPIPQGTPSLSSILTMISLCPCPYVKKDVKLSKRCQVVKKMSNVKKSNTWTMEEVHKKINWHNEVHTYWSQFWCHIWWWPKTLKMIIESVFEQFWWPSYLTSKLTSKFFWILWSVLTVITMNCCCFAGFNFSNFLLLYLSGLFCCPVYCYAMCICIPLLGLVCCFPL